jgi:hypothetical protein
MKTFFTVKFALLPIAVFVFLIVRGAPAAAIGAGFMVSGVVCAWRLYAREIKSLEIATFAIFGALAAGIFLARDFVVAEALPLSFVGLGVFSLVTVALRKPWTAEFSRAAYPDAADNPVFILVNMILSALWACCSCCWRWRTPRKPAASSPRASSPPAHSPRCLDQDF